ncbi:hypothetical protein AAFF_G00304970 [Aldrovandia affinis]|uniref:Uncharacterized protein n=1 Tax=Aldrovandia affinis TaxID=143900 RepID=A0AAD7SR71_9TELE|nr:hypothetical protein AAFF_G00304970 [Aldrovandia affinis]
MGSPAVPSLTTDRAAQRLGQACDRSPLPGLNEDLPSFNYQPRCVQHKGLRLQSNRIPGQKRWRRKRASRSEGCGGVSDRGPAERGGELFMWPSRPLHSQACLRPQACTAGDSPTAPTQPLISLRAGGWGAGLRQAVPARGRLTFEEGGQVDRGHAENAAPHSPGSKIPTGPSSRGAPDRAVPQTERRSDPFHGEQGRGFLPPMGQMSPLVLQ